MKFIKNLITTLIFFSVFFILYFAVYTFEVLEANNAYARLSFTLIKNTMEHYFGSVSMVSAVSAIIFLGALNKLNGKISILLSIMFLGIIITLYPAYTFLFNKNVDYLRNELRDKSSLFIEEENGYFTKVDKYLIKVGYKLLDNTYKNSILILTEGGTKLYISDYIYFTDKEISLYEVNEIEKRTENTKSSIVFDRTSIENYLSNLSRNIVFAFEVFPIISAVLKIISLENMPVYYILISFASLSFFLFSLYILGLSLSSKQYVYHNILIGFIINFIIKILLVIFIKNYNLLYIILTKLNYYTVNISIFSISIIIIISSLILKKIFNGKKRIKKDTEA